MEAQRLLKGIKDKGERKRLESKLNDILSNPLRGKKLECYGKNTNVYRQRVGKMRVVYRYDDGKVELIEAGYRRDIYGRGRK